MATTKGKRYADTVADYAVYAPLGAGQLALEKARDLVRGDVLGAYRDLAKRGRKLVEGIRRSPATRQAEEQIRAARVQLRGTARSARRSGRASSRAAKATATAARSAARQAV